jgi:putative membrane protein
MKLIGRWCLAALTLLVLARYVPGIEIGSVVGAFVAVLVLGLLNAVVRPVVILLTLPVTILTLGLFLVVINGIFFALASAVVPQFSVSGAFPALVGALGMSLSSLVAQRLFH